MRWATRAGVHTAVITSGGAYAVLAFVAQRAVEHYAWLSARDLVRGLAPETTPGPLIMVVQFVAFLGAYHHPGPGHHTRGRTPTRAGAIRNQTKHLQSPTPNP